jgi:hypothetical protein
VSRHHRNGNRGRASVELGSSVGETAKAQEEQFAGVLVVLMRAGIKALGFCTELSMAATMWWPAAAREFVACAEKGSKEGGTGPGRGEREAWREGKQEVGCGGLHSGGRGSRTGGSAGEAGEQRGSEEEEEREKVRRTYVQN